MGHGRWVVLWRRKVRSWDSSRHPDHRANRGGDSSSSGFLFLSPPFCFPDAGAAQPFTHLTVGAPAPLLHPSPCSPSIAATLSSLSTSLHGRAPSVASSSCDGTTAARASRRGSRATAIGLPFSPRHGEEDNGSGGSSVTVHIGTKGKRWNLEGILVSLTRKIG